MSMNKNAAHRFRRIGARCLLAALALPACYGAWAAANAPQPEAKADSKDIYQLVAKYSLGSGVERSFRMAGLGIGAHDSGFRIAPGADKEPCDSEWAVSFASAETARLSGIVRCRGAIVAQPAITVKVGQPGAIEYQGADAEANFRLSVLVTRMPAAQ